GDCFFASLACDSSARACDLLPSVWPLPDCALLLPACALALELERAPPCAVRLLVCRPELAAALRFDPDCRPLLGAASEPLEDPLEDERLRVVPRFDVPR